MHLRRSEMRPLPVTYNSILKSMTKNGFTRMKALVLTENIFPIDRRNKITKRLNK